MKTTTVLTAVLALAGLVFAGPVHAHGDKVHKKTTHPAEAGSLAFAPKNVKWNTLQAGLRKAKELNRPLMVDFGMPEACSRCEFFDKNVYSRKVITDKINAEFVPVWINLGASLGPEEEALSREFDVANECLMLFLDQDGRVIRDPEGKRMCFRGEIPPEVFMEHLDYVKSHYTN